LEDLSKDREVTQPDIVDDGDCFTVAPSP